MAQVRAAKRERFSKGVVLWLSQPGICSQTGSCPAPTLASQGVWRGVGSSRPPPCPYPSFAESAEGEQRIQWQHN